MAPDGGFRAGRCRYDSRGGARSFHGAGVRAAHHILPSPTARLYGSCMERHGHLLSATLQCSLQGEVFRAEHRIAGIWISAFDYA